MTDLLLAEITLQSCEGGGLAPAGWFPYGADIGYMKVDQITEGVQAGDGRSVGRQSLIDQGFGLTGPFAGIVAAKECLARDLGNFGDIGAQFGEDTIKMQENQSYKLSVAPMMDWTDFI